MGIGEAEAFSERLKRELQALEAANVHAILENEPLINEVTYEFPFDCWRSPSRLLFFFLHFISFLITVIYVPERSLSLSPSPPPWY